MLYCLGLDNPKPGFDACFESRAFAQAGRYLHAVAGQLKIKSPYELFSYAAQNDLCPPGLEEAEVPWFEPQEGIDWLDVVIAHVRANPSAVDEPDRLVRDLTECQAILRRAEAIGAKWHFEMDF